MNDLDHKLKPWTFGTDPRTLTPDEITTIFGLAAESIDELEATIKRLEKKNRRYRRAAENWRRKAVILQHRLNDRSVP